MIYILSAAQGTTAEAAPFLRQAEFRKATLNMALTYVATQRALAVLPAALMQECKEQMGITLGTSHGEMETSKEFLKGLAVGKTARPILFQNSLHNATLGFLTMHFALLGPGLTISNQYFSGEDALLNAKVLLASGECLFCLAVGVDTLVPDLEPVRDLIYPAGLRRGAGAACVLLTAAAGLAKLADPRPLAELGDIEYERQRRAISRAEAQYFGPQYYDADAIANLTLALSSEFDTSPLFLRKPDGCSSSVAFRRL